jgi:hypothetical protein
VPIFEDQCMCLSTHPRRSAPLLLLPRLVPGPALTAAGTGLHSGAWLQVLHQLNQTAGMACAAIMCNAVVQASFRHAKHTAALVCNSQTCADDGCASNTSALLLFAQLATGAQCVRPSQALLPQQCYNHCSQLQLLLLLLLPIQ